MTTNFKKHPFYTRLACMAQVEGIWKKKLPSHASKSATFEVENSGSMKNRYKCVRKFGHLYIHLAQIVCLIKYYSSWLLVSSQLFLSVLDGYAIIRKYNEFNHRDHARLVSRPSYLGRLLGGCVLDLHSTTQVV